VAKAAILSDGLAGVFAVQAGGELVIAVVGVSGRVVCGIMVNVVLGPKRSRYAV